MVSKCAVVLKSSYVPFMATVSVFAINEATADSFMGWKDLAAANAWSNSIFELIPVIRLSALLAESAGIRLHCTALENDAVSKALHAENAERAIFRLSVRRSSPQ